MNLANKKVGLAVLALTLLLAGCQEQVEKTTETVKEVVKEKTVGSNEMNAFIDETNIILEATEASELAYESEFVQREDDEKAMAYLKDVYLPQYLSFVEEAQSIAITLPDIDELRNEFIAMLQKNIEGTNKIIEAYETENDALYDEADALYEERSVLGDAYNENVVQLAKKYKILLVLEE